jgi:hypothetical protein
VTEDVENYRLDDARTKLAELAAELAASLAKDTPFVIRLQAQVDEMIDSLKPMEMPPAPPVGGLARSPAAWFGAAPSVAPVVSRLASNTTVLVNQRGIMSSGSSSGVPGPAPAHAYAPALFSSPSQRSASNRLATAYSSGSSQVPAAAAGGVAPPPPVLASEPSVTVSVPTVVEESSASGSESGDA